MNHRMNMNKPLGYILSTIAIIAIGKYACDELTILAKHYATEFAHEVVRKELASDRVTYEIKGQTVTAAEASDADLRKALFYERTRATSCEEAMRDISATLALVSPAL